MAMSGGLRADDWTPPLAVAGGDVISSPPRQSASRPTLLADSLTGLNPIE